MGNTYFEAGYHLICSWLVSCPTIWVRLFRHLTFLNRSNLPAKVDGETTTMSCPYLCDRVSVREFRFLRRSPVTLQRKERRKEPRKPLCWTDSPCFQECGFPKGGFPVGSPPPAAETSFGSGGKKPKTRTKAALSLALSLSLSLSLLRKRMFGSHLPQLFAKRSRKRGEPT